MGLFNIKGILSSMTTFLAVIIGFIGVSIVIYGFDQNSLLIKIIGNIITIISCSYLFVTASKQISTEKNGFGKATGAIKIILGGLIILFLLLSNFFI